MAEKKTEGKSGAGKSRHIQSIVFGAILLILFILVCRLFAPFFTVLLWSVLIYILLKPLHQRCVKPFEKKTTLRDKICYNAVAVVFSLGSMVLVLLLLFLVASQFFRQITEIILHARDWLVSYSANENDIFEDISRVIREFSSGQIVIEAGEIRSQVMTFLSSGMRNVFRFSGSAARNVGTFLASLFFMVFTLFFFFVDGGYLSRVALRVIPIRKEYIKALVGKFKDIARQLVLGYVIVALAEAVAAFVIFSIFKIPGVMVFAALIFFFSFIPLLGPSFIYIPLGLVQIFDGNLWRGILLMVISSGFISSIENILRPLILRDRIQLHPLIIFFAILGGIGLFGANGIILGPMVIILFLTVFDLFLTEHKFEKDEEHGSE